MQRKMPSPPMLARLGVALGVLLAGCSSSPQPNPPIRPSPTSQAAATPPPTPATPRHAVGKRVQIVEKAMGTRVVLASYTTDELDEEAVKDVLLAGLEEIQRLETLMTTWSNDSEVSRINQAAGDKAITVSPETLDVITKSLWISKRSEGAFDITFASMGKLWRFDEDRVALIPDADKLEAARKRIDWTQIQVDPTARSVMLKREETKISLGGIAKGYAVDRAAGLLRARGLSTFYAQAGGDLYVEGTKPNGKPWTVGVRDPRGKEGSVIAVLPITNHAFSTAGDYERAFVKNGKRYHHIIDPRTGYPATESRSVTIWARDALTADAIDDAVFILGAKKGLALVESIDDCGAVIVDKDNKVWVSSRLRGVVKLVGKPTPGI